MAKFESKNLILTKKLNGVIYELMVKTNSDMVYVTKEETLTEKLIEISDLLTDYHGEYSGLRTEFNKVMKDAPETFNSFKEVWDYVNVNGDPKSALIRMIEAKQDAEEGKGLSTHDFDDILYAKLKYGYSKEELDAKFKIILDAQKEINEDIEERVSDLEEKPNIVVSETIGTDITDYSCWYQIVTRDE